jgi:release factor glutamine methyltransferase
MTVRELLNRACLDLAATEGARLDSEVLLCNVLEVNRAWLYANPNAEVGQNKLLAFKRLIQRRSKGEPVAYLTGTREFWSLKLKVTPDVLIPRPETELLVETVLEFIPPEVDWRVADLGCGSGAVALAIARERPACRVHASEISPAALAVARENTKSNTCENVCFHLGSWFEPLQGVFRVIVSNPPYVADGDPHLNDGDCRFEPREALTSGPDDMAAIRRIAGESLRYLESGGMLVLEHGWQQGEKTRGLLQDLGYADVKTRKDLAALERVTSGIRSGKQTFRG